MRGAAARPARRRGSFRRRPARLAARAERAAATAILAILVPVAVGRLDGAPRGDPHRLEEIHALLGALSVPSCSALQYDALLSAALLRDTPQPDHAAAFALIAGGVVLSQRSARAR